MSFRIIRTTYILLFMLVFINYLWAFLYHRIGPVAGASVYAFVILVYWRRQEFHPVLFVAVAGLALHIVELFGAISADSIRPEILFLLANVIIPILLVCLGLRFVVSKRSGVSTGAKQSAESGYSDE